MALGGGLPAPTAAAPVPARGGSSTRMVDLLGTTTSLLVGVAIEPLAAAPAAAGTRGTAGGSVEDVGTGLDVPVEVGVGARRCAFRLAGGTGEGEGEFWRMAWYCCWPAPESECECEDASDPSLDSCGLPRAACSARYCCCCCCCCCCWKPWFAIGDRRGSTVSPSSLNSGYRLSSSK